MTKQEVMKEISDLPKYDNYGKACVEFEKVAELLLKLNEPEKPVVPQFVADWIDYCKENHLTIIGAFNPISENGISLAETFKGDGCKCTKWALGNQDIFTRAWVNGYEVEKEKLYTVEIPNPNNSTKTSVYLAKYKNDKVELFSWTGYPLIIASNGWKKEENAQLTEEEIKEDFDWAWQFAEEVEE